MLHILNSVMTFFVFFLNNFFQVWFFVLLDLTEWLTIEHLKGFKNIIALSAFDRVSYWTDKIVLHIPFSFFQHYFEIMGRGASYMIPG